MRCNPGHDRGRAYGGYARGWQRQQHPGYRYSGSRVNTDRARSVQQVGFTQRNSSNQAAARCSVNTMAMIGEQSQQTSRDSQQELTVPEVFKAQEAGKAKVDEGSLGDASKPFCFRCYKPGHGKLECNAKLFCDICASSEHLTGRCPILKQPRLMFHKFWRPGRTLFRILKLGHWRKSVKSKILQGPHVSDTSGHLRLPQVAARSLSPAPACLHCLTATCLALHRCWEASRKLSTCSVAP
jgi:hypothetical protein